MNMWTDNFITAKVDIGAIKKMKYVIYFKYKDDDGKPNEGPLDTYDSHMEAVAFRDGYMQAILNHTGNAKQSEACC